MDRAVALTALRRSSLKLLGAVDTAKDRADQERAIRACMEAGVSDEDIARESRRDVRAIARLRQFFSAGSRPA